MGLRGRISKEALAHTAAKAARDATGLTAFRTARLAAKDPSVFQKLSEQLVRAYEYEDAVKGAINPLPGMVRRFKGDLVAESAERVRTWEGVLFNLGAHADPQTGRPVFGMYPKEGAGEWDWFYNLTPRERTYLKNQYMRPHRGRPSITRTKSGKTKVIPGRVLEFGGVDKIVSDSDVVSRVGELSIDQWADQFVTATRNLKEARVNRRLWTRTGDARRTTRATVGDIKTEYANRAVQELERFEPEMSSRDVERILELMPGNVHRKTTTIRRSMQTAEQVAAPRRMTNSRAWHNSFS